MSKRVVFYIKKTVFFVLALSCFSIGLFFLWKGFNSSPPPPPDIKAPITAVANQTPVGPHDGLVLTNQDDPESKVFVKARELEPNQLFIPSIGTLASVTGGEDGVVKNGFLTLPEANKVTRWQEGASVTSTEGTILVAGHVSYGGAKGAIYNLATLQMGAQAFISDKTGVTRAFQLTSLTPYKKAELPQNIWTNVGEKKLVVVTCGGELQKHGNSYHFDSNIVATWKPIPMPGETSIPELTKNNNDTNTNNETNQEPSEHEEVNNNTMQQDNNDRKENPELPSPVINQEQNNMIPSQSLTNTRLKPVDSNSRIIKNNDGTITINDKTYKLVKHSSANNN